MSQRSSGRKNARPATQPSRRARRGVHAEAAKASTGASAIHPRRSHPGRGNASCIANPASIATTRRRAPSTDRAPPAATGSTPVSRDRTGGRRAELPPDPVEEPVDEAGRLLGREPSRDLERLVDGDLRRDIYTPQELPDPRPKDVPIHDGHPIELPVLGEPRDHLV